MEVIKGIAVWAIFIVGLFVLGTISLLVGGVWDIVWASWMGFWVVVGILAAIGSPD